MYFEQSAPTARRLSFQAPSDLSPATRDAIWELVSRAISANRNDFEAGLLKMDEIWLLEIGGRVKGFGGVRLFYPPRKQRNVCVIFTGRVYLDPAVRGNQILQKVGFRYYLYSLRRNPFQPVYWMFGAGSYKSYLLLARNFRSYWPHPSLPLPVQERALLDDVAQAMNGPFYNAETGIMSHPELIYLDSVVTSNKNEVRDPDIAFYTKINPGQDRGDDVMCLCPLTPSNWFACFQKAITRGLRRTAGSRTSNNAADAS